MEQDGLETLAGEDRGDVVPLNGFSRPNTPRAYGAGDVIAGKYRLLHALGEGGMGTVWLARNQTLEIDVAVKLIRADVSTTLARDRLLREARTAARLTHPSIVRVFDFGETDAGDPYIVMEVVRGDSLADVLDRKGSLSPTNAVRLLLPIASALTAAHARGIVHRDIKPENIILAADDEQGAITPKLVDFGIAKVRREDQIRRPLTVDGAVLGSPDYMSPEQARGASDVDERSDVWGYCVLLYETMCGPRPFEGQSYGALMSAILTEDPRPIVDHGVGDDELWQVLQRGLEKRRDDRWSSMRALCSVLAQWVAGRGASSDITGAALSRHWVSEHPEGLFSLEPDEEGSREDAPTPFVAKRSESPAESEIVVPMTSERGRVRYLLAAGVLVLIGGVGWSLLPAPASDPSTFRAQTVSSLLVTRGRATKDVAGAASSARSSATPERSKPAAKPRAARPRKPAPVAPAKKRTPVDTSGIKEPSF